ncbi:MAG: hypothetical protein IKI61_02735 [Erysipelotrichaceae bacterium]|nr:hypothetical protein [Erysipelotrichaceae bacterium]
MNTRRKPRKILTGENCQDLFYINIFELFHCSVQESTSQIIDQTSLAKSFLAAMADIPILCFVIG